MLSNYQSYNMASAHTGKGDDEYRFFESKDVSSVCVGDQRSETGDGGVRQNIYDGSHPTFPYHINNVGDDAEIAALYYQLKRKANGEQFDNTNQNAHPGNPMFMNQYDHSTVNLPNNQQNKMPPGQMYMANSRPSLRSQREHLAAQAKGMPRITGVHFEKKSPAWVANWKENGTKKRIWFRVSEFGMEEAYRRAVDARHNAEKHLPRKDRTVRKERRRQIETDFAEQLKGLPRIMGVRFDRFDMAWVASWSERKKERKKMFSIHLYGFEGARQMAIEHREKRLLEAEQNRALQEKEEDVPPQYDDGQIKNEREEHMGSAAVYYDTATQSWVTCWAAGGMTRVRRFPTSKYGFEEAYRLAVQYKNFPQSNQDQTGLQGASFNGTTEQTNNLNWMNTNKADENINKIDPSFSSSNPAIDNGHQPEANQDSLAKLTKDEYKGLIIECLIDLRDRVIIHMVGNNNEQSQPPPRMLEYHLSVVNAANTEHALRPYLTLFNECLIRKQLPSSSAIEVQQSILHTLSLLMTLTQLLAENDRTENKNDHENSNYTEADTSNAEKTQE